MTTQSQSNTRALQDVAQATIAAYTEGKATKRQKAAAYTQLDRAEQLDQAERRIPTHH